MNPFLRFWTALFLSTALLLAACVWVCHRHIQRPLPELRDGVVEIKPGWSLSEISGAVFGSSRLDGGCFKFYAVLTGRSRKLRAGEYLLQNDSIQSLARKLTEGKVLQYRVTVAEGIWSADIATLLASERLGDRDRLLALIHDPVFTRELAGPSAPSLEGYLFPETYFFTRGMTEKEILKTFVSRFNDLARPVLKSDTLSVHEALTLASMVEREAAVDEERPLIAGIFLNRLKKHMPLESCVTVEYAMGRKKKQLLDEDLRIDSPYNTYRHAGLPPGPVGNPGLKSIRAVMDPAPTDDLFFVARGDGRHIFSKTWADHQRAKRKAAALRRNLSK